MLAFVVAGLVMLAGAPAAELTDVRITVLYDNTKAVGGTRADWGFACLVETPSGRVLFDSGTQDWVLRHNLEKLGVDLSGIDAIVLSHEHADHTGAVFSVLEQVPGVRLYVPAEFPDGFHRQASRSGAKVIRVGVPVEIVPGIWTTGEVDGTITEQALVVASSRGPIVITGCAHPGVVTLAECAARVADRAPYMVLGGFHLLRAEPDEIAKVVAELRSLGVVRVGPGHCSGETVIERFREEFGDDFVGLGVGTVVQVGG